MPHQNLSPEFMFAIAIWLMAIFIFVMMLFAAFVSFLSKHRTEIKVRLEAQLKFSSMMERFTYFFPKKSSKIKRGPDVS